MKISGVGQSALISALDALETLGYLRRSRDQAHQDNGKFGGVRYEFFDTPQEEAAPCVDFPYTDEPYTENRAQEIIKQETKKQEEPPKPPKSKKNPMPAELIARVEHYAGEDLQLRDALLEFARMRDARKKTIKTDRQLTLLLSKLNELSGGRRRDKIALIEKATVNEWLSFYPLRDDDLPATAPPDGRIVDVPAEVAQW